MQPEYSDPKKQSRKVVNAALKALPGQRKAEAAARLGVEVEYEADNWIRPRDAYKQGLITKEQWDYFQDLNEEGSGGWMQDNLIPGTEPIASGPGKPDDNRKGKHFGYGVRVKDGKMQINLGKRKADFRGLGDAEVQGQLARQMAEVQMDLQKKYGADFVEEARKQQELADPEGAAARRMLADEVNRMEDERATRRRPVADALDAQIIGDLTSGSGLDAESDAAIAEVLARRGGTTLGDDDIAAALESGIAGDARTSARMQRALSYLGSGNSPTDAAFRDRQQSVANMAAFLGGRTPQSQFQGNQAAQQGASPMPQAGGLPNVPGNLNQQAGQVGLGAYQSGVRNAAVNPYMAGLALAIQGAGTAGQAGWQPLKK
jgi:hypothetical protein